MKPGMEARAIRLGYYIKSQRPLGDVAQQRGLNHMYKVLGSIPSGGKINKWSKKLVAL